MCPKVRVEGPSEGKSKACVLRSPAPTSSAFQELTHWAPQASPAVIAVCGGGDDLGSMPL